MDLYCADHTFNVCVGKPTEEQRKLEKVWHEAIDTMLQNIKPGVVMVTRLAGRARSSRARVSTNM
jgi:Xaa-Pro aminopeptidase